MKKILLTGVAGFIGSNVTQKLLEQGYYVAGIDNLNPYYDPKLKEARIAKILNHPNFTFYHFDITDIIALKNIMEAEEKFDAIIHLAAQAGVRYSISNPFAYQETNNKGTLNLLELARHNFIDKFVFASSSSVYGGSKDMPFKEDNPVNCPVSLYAATKRNGELMCHVYNQLYGLNCVCLRFFTVYGPWGRPDMAFFKFTKNIFERKEIDVYNYGKMQRDFSYIEDIADGVIRALKIDCKYEIFNLAGGRTVELMHCIKLLEDAIGIKAKMNMMDMQQGDVKNTSGDITKAKQQLGYNPQTPVEIGILNFVKWYKKYYGVKK